MKKLLLISSLSLILAACSNDESNTEDTTKEKEVVEENKKDDITDKQKDIPKEIKKMNPTKVRNDTTGKWKKSRTSDVIQMPEQALDYYNEHMEDDEMHYIIDFNNNTTIGLNVMSGILFVTIHEYVDKEEHDADTIGSGEILKEYQINLENKEIN